MYMKNKSCTLGIQAQNAAGTSTLTIPAGKTVVFVSATAEVAPSSGGSYAVVEGLASAGGCETHNYTAAGAGGCSSAASTSQRIDVPFKLAADWVINLAVGDKGRASVLVVYY